MMRTTLNAFDVAPRLLSRGLAAGLALGLASLTARGGAVVMDLQADTVFGFNTSGLHDTEEVFERNGKRYTTTLKPATPGEIPNTIGDFFSTGLNAWADANTDWTFASAVHTLSDSSVKIRTYDAYHKADGQGVEFHAEYVPGAGDPVSNIHWIQVVRNNWNITAPDMADQGPGQDELIIDLHSTATSPYYDDGFAADSRDFYDFPGRDEATEMFWEAELFLAVGPAAGVPGLVTLYRPGIQWGWETTMEVIPSPGAAALLALGGITCVRRRR